MTDRLTELTGTLSGWLWGTPTLVLLVGSGLYLTLRMGFVQVRAFRHGAAIAMGYHDRADDPGEVSHFQALTTALSATVGTGNIAGVATAIAFGGPGAAFWMWVTALLGMATKFTSCTLAVHFRSMAPNGAIAGGPMYTLRDGLGMPRLGAAFALFTLIASFGIGNMVQANSVMDGQRYLSPTLAQGLPQKAIALSLAILVGLVILGGIRSIARVASVIVPVMALFYCGAALIVLARNLSAIPDAFATIFNLALNPAAAGGGALGLAIQYGVARGVFSNEAGLGSSPIAHAAAATSEPVREGLVAMMEPFIDTLIICTLTALVIVISGYWGDARPVELKGAALSAHAFSASLGNWGGMVVGVGLAFFAFSTIIAWSYYGDRCAYFLFGDMGIKPYRVLYVAAVALGATLPLELVWNLADIANILMFVPNLISLLLLAGLVRRMQLAYFAKKSAADRS